MSQDNRAIAIHRPSSSRVAHCHGASRPERTLFSLLVLSLLALAGCTPTLDAAQVETQIQEDLGQQEGLTLKAVECPEKVAIALDASFICTGELDPEGTFPITVTQTDEQGTVEWDVPSSKTLLNLEELETSFQEAIATETGTQPILDCGGVYRVNKPGDNFECRVTDATPVKQGQTQTLLVNVVVKLDPQGNITWQQIRRQQIIASAATPSSSPTPNAANRANQPSPNAAASPAANSPAANSSPAAAPAPAGQTAEDFLNNPNALDGF